MCFTLASFSGAEAGGRIALLLGAEKYQHFQTSKITLAHVSALADALTKQGFDVATVADPGNAAVRAALSDFSRKADNADFALIVAAGHFATYRRQSFFLPTNARVRRATDLFSRGLSAKNIADIAGRAKAGALLMLMTVPDIPSTIDGISARPGFDDPPPANVVVTFSSSTKVPVSSVGGVTDRAMKDLIDAAGEKPMKLAALVDAASAGATGLVFGKVAELDLSKDLSPPAPAKTQETAQAKALTEAEREARMLAEARLSEAEERARLAEDRAKQTEERAKRDLAMAAAAAEKAAQKAAEQAAARRAAEKAAKERSKTATAKPQPPATTEPAIKREANNIQSLQVVEALLGRGQRKVIQRLLKDMGLYEGSVDAIFGDLTRQAIRAFQKKQGAEETGYLTPEQFQTLVASR